MTTVFYLVLYVYAGVFAKGDSVSITSIPQDSYQACMDAGNQAKKLVDGSAKELRFTCVKGVMK